jgi:hypothetical protein
MQVSLITSSAETTPFNADGPPGEKAEDIAQSAHHEVLAAARNRIRSG